MPGRGDRSLHWAPILMAATAFFAAPWFFVLLRWADESSPKSEFPGLVASVLLGALAAGLVAGLFVPKPRPGPAWATLLIGLGAAYVAAWTFAMMGPGGLLPVAPTTFATFLTVLAPLAVATGGVCAAIVARRRETRLSSPAP